MRICAFYKLPDGRGNAGNINAKAEEKNTMSEQINNAPAIEPEKTFTQAEVDRIIGERVAREREKYADYGTLKEKAAKFDEAAEANKTELQRATERAEELQRKLDAREKADGERAIREKVAAETKVPANLLTGADEETCRQQAAAILAFAKPANYPAVPDAGEHHRTGGGKTRDQFSAWFNNQLN